MTNPTARAKVLNIIMASSDGSLPTSPISDNLNSEIKLKEKEAILVEILRQCNPKNSFYFHYYYI